MKRSASGDSAGNVSDAGSALLDPAYKKYVPNLKHNPSKSPLI
jgi:hypothetical protein